MTDEELREQQKRLLGDLGYWTKVTDNRSDPLVLAALLRASAEELDRRGRGQELRMTRRTSWAALAVAGVAAGAALVQAWAPLRKAELAPAPRVELTCPQPAVPPWRL